jgi:hypothetical protein
MAIPARLNPGVQAGAALEAIAHGTKAIGTKAGATAIGIPGAVTRQPFYGL